VRRNQHPRLLHLQAPRLLDRTEEVRLLLQESGRRSTEGTRNDDGQQPAHDIWYRGSRQQRVSAERLVVSAHNSVLFSPRSARKAVIYPAACMGSIRCAP